MKELEQTVQKQGGVKLKENAVEARAVELFAFEVLLKPSEKSLDTPAQSVYIGYFLSCKVKTVCDKVKDFAL